MGRLRRTRNLHRRSSGTHPLQARRAADRGRCQRNHSAARRQAGQMIRLLLAAGALAAIIGATEPAYAVRPDEMLADPALEARAEQVGHGLRCLVCRNQSIEDSESDLAHDLRLLVRRRIAAGDSNAEVVAYLRSRYGDYVLLRPPFEISTALLWGGPALILLLGGAAVARLYRRGGEAQTAPLSPDERRRLATVLGDGDAP